LSNPPAKGCPVAEKNCAPLPIGDRVTGMDYLILVIIALLLLIEYLVGKWFKGNEAQRLLDKFRLPLR
jgi:hypothetical protein